jgi:hypothetical protein
MSWQPIETAPKDGCLYLFHTRNGATFVGKYNKHLRLWVDDKGRLEHANHGITHWMPLPEPPRTSLKPCPKCGKKQPIGDKCVECGLEFHPPA